jgi:large repetitive protein
MAVASNSPHWEGFSFFEVIARSMSYTSMKKLIEKVTTLLGLDRLQKLFRPAPRQLTFEGLESRQVLTSISGTVYADINSNNSLDTTDTVLQGVMLTLNGTNSSGQAIASQTTTTDANGNYTFSNLEPGTYSITESQRTDLQNGISQPGNLGGTAGENVISGIVVGSTPGTGYNFTEKGLISSKVSINLFLASTPTSYQILNGTSTAANLAPLVTSIIRSSANPTAASTVSYTVTFSEIVSGVDAGDFTLLTTGNVSGASIASVTGNGAIYTVTVNTGTGSGTLSLSLVDNDSIFDTSGIALGGTGTGNGNFTGPAYTINKLTFTSVTNPINSANAANVSASGQGLPGATVSIVVSNGSNSLPALTTTVNSNGTWSLAGIDVSGLPDGTLTFTATQNEASGTFSASLTSTKDTVAPAIAIATITNPINTNNQTSVSVSGTGEAGRTVTLQVSDGTITTTVVTTTVDGSGNWSINGINVSSLADGTLTFTARITDAAGNQSTVTGTATKDVAAPAISIDSVTNPIGLATQINAIASGTGEAGAAISLSVTDGVSTTTAYSTTVDGSGNWSISNIDVSALKVGTLTFNVTATDAAGNSSTDTLTSVKSTIVVATATNPVNLNNQTNVSVGGTGQAGANVTLTASDGTNTTATYTTTIDGSGNWAITGIDVSSLTDGTLTFSAIADDGAGNTATSTLTVTKNTVAPTATFNAVTNPINAGNAAATSASGTGDAGNAISLAVTDGVTTSTTYNATVDSAGNWTITGIDVSGLADGMLTYNVTATNSVGNTVTVSLTALKDTVAPAATFDAVTNPINASAALNTTASGTGEANATITLTATDGTTTTPTFTTTVDGTGNWSFAGINVSGLLDGTITFTAIATDTAGNTTATQLTAIKNTAAPQVTIATVTNPIGIAAQVNVTSSGTGEAGDSINLIATDGSSSTIAYTTTVDSSGNWSISGIDVSALNDGTINFAVTATNSLGNTATVNLSSLKETVFVAAVTNPINAANVAAVAASGTGQSGATVTLTVTDGVTTTISYTTTIDNAGNWSITGIDVTALAEGTLTFTAVADDGASNTETSILTAIKDTVAPAVGLLNVTNPINLSNAAAATASGTGEAGAAISLTVTDGVNTTAVYTTTVNGTGNWSITGIDLTVLNDGAVTFDVTAADAANNTTAASLGALKDTVAPNLTSNPVVNPIGLATQTNVSVSGTGDVGDTVSLTFTDGTIITPVYTAVVDSAGNWTISGINVSTLADGPLTMSVSATDAAGNTTTTSAASVKATLSFTTITNPINLANATAVSAAGTGQIGATITLFISDGATTLPNLTTTVDGAGNWTITGINVSGLNDGNLTFTAIADDGSGNTTAKILASNKDTVPPIVDIGTATNAINAANANAVIASGTGESGNTIALSVSDGSNTTSLYTTTVDGSGNWSIAGIDVSALADGTLTITVSATDTAGNTTTDTLTRNKDTLAPPVAFVTVTSSINTGNVTAASATGTSEAGAVISLTVTDGITTTIAYTTIADGTGNWSITGIDLSALNDGILTFTVSATDAFGNAANNTETAFKDTLAPALALATVTSPINASNANAISASGNAEATAIVSLTITDGVNTTIAYTTSSDITGNWSLSGIDVSSLNDGTLTIEVTATDASGNTANTTQTVLKDSLAPMSAIASVTNPINAANQALVSTTGTGEAGATITLVVKDGSSNLAPRTTTVDGTGNWSIGGIDVSSLADGLVTFSITATDAVGNTAVAIEATATKDTAPPPVVVGSVTDPINTATVTNVTASGTGENGATISLTVNDGNTTTTAYTTAVDSAGNWSISGIDVSALADGLLTVSVTAADSAGNTALASMTTTKDTTV